MKKLLNWLRGYRLYVITIVAVIVLGGFAAYAGGLTDFVRNADWAGVLDALNGEDINKVDEHGDTALMVAVSIGDLDITAKLIQEGADVNKPGEKESISNTPMAIAAMNGDYEMLNLLLGYHAEDPWLSKIPEFDPFGVNPYIYPGDRHYEHPGWIEGVLDESLPPELVHLVRDQNVHGPCDGGLTRNIITGEEGHGKDRDRYSYSQFSDGVLIECYVDYPSYISRTGVVYPWGVNHIEDGGPFVNVRVVEHTQRVKSAHIRFGGRVIELVNTDMGVYEGTIEGVDECETFLIELCKQTGDVVASYAITNELTGAVPGAVTIEMTRWPGNSNHSDTNGDGSSDDDNNHGNSGNNGNNGNHGNHGNSHH